MEKCLTCSFCGRPIFGKTDCFMVNKGGDKFICDACAPDDGAGEPFITIWPGEDYKGKVKVWAQAMN